MNCSSMQGKGGQLVPYIVLHHPDFIYLHELLVDLDAARLVGLPCRLFSGDTFRGGSVAVLVHLRRVGRVKVSVWKERHVLGVCVRPETPEAVGVIAAHFPPRCTLKSVRTYANRLSGFSGALMPHSSSSKAILMQRQGGLGVRVSKALALGGSLVTMVCPCPLGSPTNIVPLRVHLEDPHAGILGHMQAQGEASGRMVERHLRLPN